VFCINKQYQQSDLCSILTKLKAALEPQRHHLNYDLLEQPCVPFDEFCHLMKELTHDASFTEHDIITLARHYQDPKDTRLPLNVILAIVHEQLKRANWEDFEYIEEQCLHHDNVRSVAIPSDAVSDSIELIEGSSIVNMQCLNVVRSFQG